MRKVINTVRAHGAFWLVWAIVHTFLAGAAAVSFGHIVEISQKLGVGAHDNAWQAYTVPFLIDGIAILGKIGRSRKFDAVTNSAGLVLMAVGGVLSLAANVAAGDNYGERGYGVLLVGGFVLAEWYSGKLSPAPAPPVEVVVEVDDAIRAKRSAAARKGAATKAANKARAAKAARTPRAPRPATVAALEAAYALPAAPVSGV